MKIPLILVSFLFIFHFNSSSQNKKRNKGLELEIGIGYNTATWKFDDYYSQGANDVTFHRANLWLKPTVRFSYDFDLFKLRKNRSIKLRPFIGYYTFGGKSRVETNGYEDIYIFRSIESGLIPTFNFKDKWQAGLGLKGQYVIDTRARFYGALFQPDSIPREWKEKEFEYFKKYAFNLGLNLRYKVKLSSKHKVHRFTIGAEGWFGISNLTAANFWPYGRQRITENNYRILIGYQL